MGTELIKVCVKEENDEIPPVPPGFETYSSFTLKRIQETEKSSTDNAINYLAPPSTSDVRSSQNETELGNCETSSIPRSLRRRPWINHVRFDNSSEKNSDPLKLDAPSLPKGVIRGCPECSNCQKVIAKWRPEDASRPELENAPIFYPSEEEFEDTLKYISSIRPLAEQYGICRIVPPPSWKPACLLKEKGIWESSAFSTRVQRVDKLQNRDSMKKSKGNNHMRRKRRKCMRMAVDCGSDTGSLQGLSDVGFCEAERFGFEPGPEFTLNAFHKYADDFKAQYFKRKENVTDVNGKIATSQEQWEPSNEDIEGEYWRIVEKATEEIEVLYGADLETGVFGSGFPKNMNQAGSASEDKYVKSGWNLNNFPRLRGSVLAYESSDISGVLVPWLYIGMCFSSFCWHVEDHHLYSLNYMHWGAPKMWYGVPGKDAPKLEEAMRKHLPDLFEEQPDLLHKLVTQLSPSVLKSEGVPVYRCVQNAREFVLTFPRAYHSGFNCGFNCAEAVNVAPVDWLPHGQIAIELYRDQGRRTSISHDKLLLGAARDAVKAHWELNLLRKNTYDNLRWNDVCGKDGILAKTLKMRVEMERVRREFLCCTASQKVRMESNFDASSERECSICYFDLHLSAAGCHCSPDKYACLNHAKQLCSCPWGTKFFLFRYDVSELNILVEALEGKLSAVYRWAKLDLGLALSSYISNNMLGGKLSYSKDGVILALPLKVVKESSISHGSSHEKDMEKHKLKLKEEAVLSVFKLKEEAVLSVPNIRAADSESKKLSAPTHDTVILLSDDEKEKPDEPLLEGAKALTRHEEVSDRLADSEEKAKLSKCKNETTSTSPLPDTAAMSQKHIGSLPSLPGNNFQSYSPQVKEEQHQTDRTQLENNYLNVSCHYSPPSVVSITNVEGNSNAKNTNTNSTLNIEGDVLYPQPCSSGKSGYDDEHEKGGSDAANISENARATVGTPSCSQNNLDRCIRQKGPRIAKVVRRINCNVEPLDYGTVLSGKLWCNSRAIFPKGYRSRARYMSVLDPTNMAYYVSEILDAGRDAPLFMVSLEQCPTEVFIHVSAAKCWEMVRERLNQEISKHHRQGKTNLPPLQPPGSLDGFEMFGFSSPEIVQAIEAMDRNRVCTEYWDSRPYSRPQIQIRQHSQFPDNGGNLLKTLGKQVPCNGPLPTGIDAILRGLFKKASSTELHSLLSIVSDRPAMDLGTVTQLLNEEIHSRPG